MKKLPSHYGKWLGKTEDGWDRYEVNQVALLQALEPKAPQPYRARIGDVVGSRINGLVGRVVEKKHTKEGTRYLLSAEKGIFSVLGSENLILIREHKSSPRAGTETATHEG